LNIQEAKETCDKILDTVAQYFVGERDMLRKVLAAALANGHILFEDYPGLGKTLLARTFATTTGCDWKRVQFTPDLMPSDITGTKVWRFNTGEFDLMKGPVFTNILLTDEINRSPPKVQAALLECMEERQVTIEGETHRLSPPFFVLATQNPLEFEGTYPLPEAQMDRFMLRISTGYAKNPEDELLILKRRSQWQVDDPTGFIDPVTSNRGFVELQNLAEKEIYVDEQVMKYIVDIIRATRESPLLTIGSSPRGGLSLMKVSKAHALTLGRDYVTPDDVKQYAVDALSHRIILKTKYSIEGSVHDRDIIQSIVDNVEVPKDFKRR
jgi:MoxR-like ATPase